MCGKGEEYWRRVGRGWLGKGICGWRLTTGVQPQPYAAIDLIHKQPVRWTDKRVVSCDGGGGVLGHPRIFINVDKPKINWCTYCGLPFVSIFRKVLGSPSLHIANSDLKAHTHHREYLESLPSTTYPLAPVNDPAEVSENQRLPGTSDQPFGQR